MIRKTVATTFLVALFVFGTIANAQAPAAPELQPIGPAPGIGLQPIDAAPPVLPQVPPAAPANQQPAPQPPKRDPAVRVKDITFIEGNRVNHVSGSGLVLGLSGTGGKSEQTRSMATNYFLRKGLDIANVDTKNMSAVMISGKMPAKARRGETILVTVSVADDATSLRGGTLNRTPLRGLDDEIYAIAQGPIIGGGVSAQGDAGSVTKNHPTVGVCEAIVEREIHCDSIVDRGRIRWVLRNKTFKTATLIANAFNSIFTGHAKALDAGTVEMLIPDTFREDIPGFISIVGELTVTPDLPARIVVNQKTGTIVFGQHVKISSVVFASENIVISTNETPVVSQPAPFSQGQTAVVPRTTIDVFESGGKYNVLNKGVSVGELANALNTLGVAPSTLINILTALRSQGAIQAELIIE